MSCRFAPVCKLASPCISARLIRSPSYSAATTARRFYQRPFGHHRNRTANTIASPGTPLVSVPGTAIGDGEVIRGHPLLATTIGPTLAHLCATCTARIYRAIGVRRGCSRRLISRSAANPRRLSVSISTSSCVNSSRPCLTGRGPGIEHERIVGSGCGPHESIGFVASRSGFLNHLIGNSP